jgi:hypothetical protein
MVRLFALTLTAALIASAADAAEIRGQYVEARTCDVWTGPCFANADFNLTGKNAVMAWRIEQGSVDDVSLDGLGVVAVIAAHNTLGLDQVGPAKAVLLVDKNATSAQREALVRFAKQQAGKLLENVVAVQDSDVRLESCQCKGNGCYELVAGTARIKTRCIEGDHDKVCGNESAFYPPLSQNVDVRPAGVVDNVFSGTGLGSSWSDHNRRGAYVGAFAVR